MPGPAPRADVIPARPTTLVLGDRQVVVDEWPLARSAEERRTVEVGATEDGQLVIAPRRHAGIGLVVGTSLVVLAGVLSAGVAAVAQVPPWLALAMAAGVGVALILLVRGQLRRQRRSRFDRRGGRLVVERRAGFRPEWRAEREVPLGSILAVQLLFQGRHSVSETQGAGEQAVSTYREFDGYELNLVLDGDPPTRLPLLALADWSWLRTAGGEVGAYLGVPVVDRLYHGG